MNIGNVLSQMGLDHGTDRFTEFHNVPAQDHVVHYAYEAPHSTPAHISVSKHPHHGDHKQSAALSALTLLAFLFFLNILQQCLKDHMNSMNPPQVTIMSAGREDEENLIKITGTNKLDKSGAIKTDVTNAKIKHKAEHIQDFTTRKPNKNLEIKTMNVSDEEEKSFMKINITEHIPNRIRPNKIIRSNNANRSSGNIFRNTNN